MEKLLYELSDCNMSSFFEDDYKGKVLVLSPDFLKPEHRNERGQLWLATGGAGCVPGEPKKTLSAIRLFDCETAEFRRGQFYGALLPPLLPDWAKLKLGAMPVSERALEWNNYTGYSPQPDGSYGTDVPLADWQEVLDYIKIQKDYQHSIEITESKNDTVIAYVKDGWCRIEPNLLLTESHNLAQSAAHSAGLKLKDAISLGLINSVSMFMVHDTADVGFISPGRLARMDEQEREAYAELLNADIKEIRPGAYGAEIVLTGVSAQALIAYDRAASGHAHLTAEEQADGQGDSMRLT